MRRAPGRAANVVSELSALLFDSGPLDKLEEDQAVFKFFADLVRRKRVRLVVPAVVLTEYLRKFDERNASRGDQVLRIFKTVEIDDVDGRQAARFGRSVAAAGGKANPSVVDLIVCAVAERYSVQIVTNDRGDFEAIRDSGAGIRVVDLSELVPA